MSKEEEIEDLERQLERFKRAIVKASPVVISKLEEKIEWVKRR